MKAVLRKTGGMGPGEEKQFLEVSLHGTRVSDRQLSPIDKGQTT